MAPSRRLGFAASFSQPYGLWELRTATAGVVYRGFGLQLSTHGFSSYNLQRYGLLYGRSVAEKWRIGAGLHLLRRTVAGYPSVLALLPNVGVQFSPGRILQFGLTVSNPTAAADLPLRGAIGVRYAIGSRVWLLLDESYSSPWGASTRFGISYRPVDAVRLNFGFRTAPAQITFGVGYAIGGQLELTAAGTQHPQLGTGFGAGIRRMSDSTGENQ
ncbi:hypothetical protein [Lewinella sp. IMCC34191]|uniref:hypothetical protein n=1 Tax=Lewinella sp. IMCC34191 TaxID=2259172 RepID=UPI001300BBB5|nr:hypothetical protein [Lewinella sp. IMCC34191]